MLVTIFVMLLPTNSALRVLSVPRTRRVPAAAVDMRCRRPASFIIRERESAERRIVGDKLAIDMMSRLVSGPMTAR